MTRYLFAFRMSYSGMAVHRIFASAGHEAFFEGHVHALHVMGGVPTGEVRYDNLRAAVAQVLGLSRRRVEAERWTALRSHYGLDALYCQPGVRGAHEKGGVEGQIGWFHRNHLGPVPEVDTLAELNAMIDRWDQQDDARRIRSRPARSASTSRPSNRCWRHCRRRRSRRVGSPLHAWTATTRSACG
ncbi:hypothetical protein ABZ318_31085 [Streptomyces sp. NPDC006197]|uniref:hypothetical protein n=1 Tax=Streptomyces sp. NPDC006197 TaxID=3156685 RepID=UPI0033A01EE8